jgi:GWxTD domain-containing protein
MKKILLIFVVVFFSVTSLKAQKVFFFYADYSTFKHSDSKSVLELYFSINQKDLKYTSAEGKYVGQANINIYIYDKSKDKVVFDDFFGLQSKVDDIDKLILNNKLIGQQNFSLPVSDYLVRLIGFDSNNKDKSDTVKFEFAVSAYDTAKSRLSDIELSTNIIKSEDKNSVYFKYGMEVIPNPDALFGMNLKTIHYYYEIYSIKRDFPGDSNYLIMSITDLSGNIIKQNKKFEIVKSDAFVETGSIDIDSLDKGVYFLKVKLLDSINGKYIEKDKKFFIYNKTKSGLLSQKDDKDFLVSEYKTMSEEKVEDEYNKSIYIRTTPENDEYSKLKTLDEKRKFMFYFWKKRKINLVSNVNDYKIEYFKKVNEANNYYRQGFMEGWKTDKGRIYITYGKPSEVESHPNESDSKGYEIWTYENIQGGAICVFAEREIGSGFYNLVNSTIRGEYRDDNWKTRLNK